MFPEREGITQKALLLLSGALFHTITLISSVALSW